MPVISENQKMAQEESESGSSSGDEQEVEIKGTKFDLSKVAEDAQVDDDSDDDDGDDESGEDEADAPGDDEADDEENASDGDNDEEGNKSGWADAMAKVLNMGKDSGAAPGLLSKAKLDTKPDSSAAEGPRDAVKRAIKKEVEDKGRLKPNVVKDRAKEKALMKLATRGVVQLFNAVRDQQKDLKSQLSAAGHSTRKREQVFKSIDKEGFLDVLSGASAKKQQHTSGSQPAKKKAKMMAEEPEESSWSVIKDDYMLGAKMKDWDKESEGEEEAA